MVRTTKVLLTVVTAAALALSMLAQALTAFADTDNQAPWHAHYFTENVEFRDAAPGDSFQFIVGFTNGGRNSWVRGAANQEARLGTGWSFGDTANPNNNTNDFDAGWASNWLSSTRIAAQDDAIVLTARQGFFTYTAKVPSTAPSGLKQIKGQPVIDGVTWLENYGYYQGFNVTAAPPPSAAISIAPTDSVTLPASTAAAPNQGARSYTATIASSVTGCVDVALINNSRVTSDNTRFRDTGGNDPFTPNNLADDLAATSPAAFIEVVNGVATAGTDDFVDCVTVPTNRQVTFSIDTTNAGADVKPVVWVDANNNNGLDLTGTADASGFRTPSETTGVGGRTTWIAAQHGSFAGNLVGSVCRKDSATNTFSLDTGASLPAATAYDAAAETAGSSADTTPSSTECDASFAYDSNDAFFSDGIPVSMATFAADLSRADEVQVGPYSNEATAQSTIRITNNTPDPALITCTVGTSGASTDDVKISINPVRPDMSSTSNVYASWSIQRRPAGQTPAASFVTIANPTTDADTTSTDLFEYTDADVAAATYDYRVRGVVDGDEGESSNECQVTTTTPGAAGLAPTSTDLFISTSAGLTNQLDTGDHFKVVFSEVMSPDSTGDVIQVQDADGTTMTIRCNASASPAAGEYGAGCAFNEVTPETVKGTEFPVNRVLTVNISGTTAPTATGQVGTVPGMQLPATVIDQGGIKDATPGDQWNVAGSPDRVIDIE